MGGCPSCGAPVGDTDFACRQCGRSFVGDPAAVAPANPYGPQGSNPYGMAAGPTPASVSAEAGLALKHAFLGLFCLGFPFGWKAVNRAKRVRAMLDQNPSWPGRGKADAAFYLGWFSVITSAIALLDFISDVIQFVRLSSS